MKQNGWFSRLILIWSYGRGTLQYDIICILILAFIFLIDPSCFNKRHNEMMQLTTMPSDVVQSSSAAVEDKGSNHDNDKTENNSP